MGRSANCHRHMTDLPQQLGVVGAGTMGAGIAQLGCLAGITTVLHDPIADALEKGAANVHVNLDKGAERGRWGADDATPPHERLSTAATINELADCDQLVDAAPYKFEDRAELCQKLGEVCRP